MEMFFWKDNQSIQYHIEKHIIERDFERKLWKKHRIEDIDNQLKDYQVATDLDKSKSELWSSYKKQSEHVVVEKGKKYIYSPEKAAYSINYESAKDKLTTCIRSIDASERQIVSCFYKPNLVVNCGYWLRVVNLLINNNSLSSRIGYYGQDFLRISSFDTDDEFYEENIIVSAVDLDYSDEDSYKKFLIKIIKNTFISEKNYWFKKQNNIKGSICKIIVDFIDKYCLSWKRINKSIYSDWLYKKIINQIRQFLDLYIDDVDDEEYKQLADAEYAFLLLSLYSVLDGDKEKYEKEVNSFDNKFNIDNKYKFKIEDRIANAKSIVDTIINLFDSVR